MGHMCLLGFLEPLCPKNIPRPNGCNQKGKSFLFQVGFLRLPSLILTWVELFSSRSPMIFLLSNPEDTSWYHLDASSHHISHSWLLPEASWTPDFYDMPFSCSFSHPSGWSFSVYVIDYSSFTWPLTVGILHGLSPSVLIYLWCFYTTTTPKCFCWALCYGLCADISICLLGISAQTIHWHLQFNKPQMQIFSSQVHSALFPYFSHLGEWHNHHLESSLIPFSLSPHKYNPPASLISLIFKYTWILSTHVPLHFHHSSSRYRAVLEECNPCGPPEIITLKRRPQGFPGGAVVEGLPANAGDTDSSPGLGRSHVPRSSWACEPQLLSLRIWSLCPATREAAIVRGPHTAMRSGPRLPQLEKALTQKRRPNTAKNK